MKLVGSIRQWLQSSQHRAAAIGIAVVLVAVAIGVPSLVGGGGSKANSLKTTNNLPDANASATPTEAPSIATSTAPPAAAKGHASATPQSSKSTGTFTKTGSGSTTVAGGDPNHPTLNAGGPPSKYANLPMGKGMDKKSIKIGVAYETNAQAYGAAYGISLSNVDQKAQAQGIVNYVNAHGGVAGRKLVPVWHAVDMAAGLHGANLGQQTCDAFTQDATVFAAVTESAPNDDCMSQRNTPVIDSSLGTSTEEATKYADYLYGPSALFSNRSMHAYVSGLNQQGFFDHMPNNLGCSASSPKIGVVIFDQEKDQLAPVLNGEFSAIGKSVGDWGYIAGDSSNVQQVVLKFKQDCVTHVITPDYSPLLFANAAANQSYYPMWGVTSAQSPSLLASNLNASELAQTWLVGWSPLADVSAANDPGPLGPDARLCIAIMKDQGLPTDRLAMGSAYSLCDSFFVLKAALDNASALTPHGLRLAYEGIGAWDSPTTFRARLGPGRHDGVAGWRAGRYDAGSKSFKYTSAVYALN